MPAAGVIIVRAQPCGCQLRAQRRAEAGHARPGVENGEASVDLTALVGAGEGGAAG
jgi:hypothetical protein